jgi:hypothetical protein
MTIGDPRSLNTPQDGLLGGVLSTKNIFDPKRDWEKMMAEAEDKKPHLPSWAVEPGTAHKLSLPGMLWLRLQNWNVSTSSAYKEGLFSIPKMTFLVVVQVTDDDGDEAVATVTVFQNHILTLMDKLPLYPSDGLMTKIITLTTD